MMLNSSALGRLNKSKVPNIDDRGSEGTANIAQVINDSADTKSTDTYYKGR